MPKYKVLIADDRYPAYEQELAVLKKIDAEVIIEPSDDENKLAEAVKGIDGLVVNLAPVTAKVVSAMDKCKCVSRYGVGYDNVDTEALKNKNIYLANVPDYCEEDVSDHALALLLDCVRKTSRKDRGVRKNQWNMTDLQNVYRIAGKTFGFVGFGLIARCLHRKLSGLNLSKVLVCDPFIDDQTAAKSNVTLVELDTLCKESDYISIHAPLLESTRGMIGAEQLAAMKKTAILINTSRGGLIDENALVNALKNSDIACAGLDVFETEPLKSDSELRNIENVTLTDHAGWYSEESMQELKTKAAQNVADTLLKGKPTYVVDL